MAKASLSSLELYATPQSSNLQTTTDDVQATHPDVPDVSQAEDGNISNEETQESSSINSSLLSLDSVHVQPEAHRLDRSQQRMSDLPMEEMLKRFLYKKVHNDVWQPCKLNEQWQVSFVVDASQCDRVFNELTALGFGKVNHTSVSLFPSSQYSADPADDRALEDTDHKHHTGKFIKSIKARLAVAQIIGEVRSNAALTFDFIMYMTLASFVAAVGLFESSSTTIVASMLIAPGEMGPIIAFAFGVMLRNGELCRIGARNEAIGVALTLAFGYVAGFASGMGISYCGPWGATDSWPTYEMQSRGLLRSLWVGAATAIPAGIGVALAVVGGKAGTLVGVAISASLIHPAVNCGALWGLATYESFVPTTRDPSIVQEGLNCSAMVNNNYQFHYSCSVMKEYAILGAISLTLTLLNVIIMFLMSVLVLKIKEVTPQIGDETEADVFWKSTIPNHRQFHRDAALFNMAAFRHQIVKEFKALHANGGKNKHELKKEWNYIVKQVEDDPPNSDFVRDVTGARHIVTPHNPVVPQPTLGGPLIGKVP